MPLWEGSCKNKFYQLKYFFDILELESKNSVISLLHDMKLFFTRKPKRVKGKQSSIFTS